MAARPAPRPPAGVLPSSQQEALELRWTVAQIERLDWFPVRDWPFIMRKTAKTVHKPQMMRLNYFKFLIGNGMRRPDASYMVLHGQYDEAAHKQVQWLSINSQRPMRNYTYYDMTEGKYLTWGNVEATVETRVNQWRQDATWTPWNDR